MDITADNETLIDAAQFFADVLGIPDDVILDIEITRKLDADGKCFQISEKEFLIALHPDGKDAITQTLAHELVHVHQIVRCDFDTRYTSPMWKGFFYDCNYDDAPWEKEAYALEKPLDMMWKSGKRYVWKGI